MPRKIFPLKLNEDERNQLRQLAAKNARSEAAVLRLLLTKACKEQTPDNPAPDRVAA